MPPAPPSVPHGDSIVTPPSFKMQSRALGELPCRLRVVAAIELRELELFVRHVCDRIPGHAELGQHGRRLPMNWPYRCRCGETWSETEWLELPEIGRYDAGRDGFIELRTCYCGAALSIPCAAPALRRAASDVHVDVRGVHLGGDLRCDLVALDAAHEVDS
jgi:hypothetical protein